MAVEKPWWAIRMEEEAKAKKAKAPAAKKKKPAAKKK